MPHIPWLEGKNFDSVLGLLLLALFVIISDQLIKFISKRMAKSMVLHQNMYLVPFLSDKNLIQWLSNLSFPISVYFGLNFIPHLPEGLVLFLQRFLLSMMIIFAPFTLSSIFRVINEQYSAKEISRTRPIKGYLQGILIVVYLMSFISGIAVLVNKSPILFLSSLGALTAILLLVFKDTILSLVAGVQLTANDLIRVGDWIEMSQFNANGDVLEIALHSVKIQNWDKTITVIPAHKFLEHSFTNWRGMQESGGRRIKRSINIDVRSIRFLDQNDIQKYSEFSLLKNYIQDKVNEISEDNKNHDKPFNTRRLTNVGTFRRYLTEYLRQRKDINHNMTFLVRQLAPDAKGLPIEIYVFTNDTRWAIYEGIQADIFDHVLAILPEFDLKYFQQPSGHDLDITKLSKFST
mgnify:CR=1 FL=1